MEKLSSKSLAKKSDSPVFETASPEVSALEAVVVAADSAKASVVKGDAPNASSIVAAAVVEAPQGSTTSFMGVTVA